MATDRILHCVEIATGIDRIPVVEELLSALESPQFSWSNRAEGTGWVRLCADTESDAEKLLGTCRCLLAACSDLFGPDGVPEAHRAGIPARNWQEAWKEHFRVFRASRRLLVKPTWANYQAGGDEIVLELDPGMCFGTGYHGTTRACLEFLDEIARATPDASMIDVGCGSGILCLAARCLGLTDVTGVDHDPDAVRVAGENLARVGITDVHLAHADLAVFAPGRTFGVVVANILAPVLLAHADRVTALVDRGVLGPGGFLLLSGILTEQYGEVRDAYCAQGFHEIRKRTIDEWTSGWFEGG